MAGKISNQTVTGSWSLLLLIIIMTSAFRCEDEKAPAFADMIFLLDLNISPTGSQIKKGDTLWLSANFPDTILEYNSGNYIKLENFDFQTRIGILKLTNNQLYLSQQPGAIESFSVYNHTGTVKNIRDTFADLSFVFLQNKYTCQIGIIPNFSGIYSIIFLRPNFLDLKFIDLGKTIDGRNIIPVYRSTYYRVNKGENNNFDLLRANAKLTMDNNPTEENIFTEQKGSFTFRVVE